MKYVFVRSNPRQDLPLSSFIMRMLAFLVLLVGCKLAPRTIGDFHNTPRSDAVEELERTSRYLDTLGGPAIYKLRMAALSQDTDIASWSRILLTELAYLQDTTPSDMDLVVTINSDRQCAFGNSGEKKVLGSFAEGDVELFLTRVTDFFISWSPVSYRRDPEMEFYTLFVEADRKALYSDLSNIWCEALHVGGRERAVLSSPGTSAYSRILLSPLESEKDSVKFRVTMTTDGPSEEPICEIKVNSRSFGHFSLSQMEKYDDRSFEKNVRTGMKEVARLHLAGGDPKRPLVAVFDCDPEVLVQYVVTVLTKLQECGIKHIEVGNFPDQECRKRFGEPQTGQFLREDQ